MHCLAWVQPEPIVDSIEENPWSNPSLCDFTQMLLRDGSDWTYQKLLTIQNLTRIIASLHIFIGYQNLKNNVKRSTFKRYIENKVPATMELIEDTTISIYCYIFFMLIEVNM